MRAAAFLAVLLIVAPAVHAETSPSAKDQIVDRGDPNYVRCKKVGQIGSLVKKERVCKTNAEWAQIAEHMQRDADDLITRSRAGMDCRAGGTGGC